MQPNFAPGSVDLQKKMGKKTGVICYFVCQLNLLSPSKFCPFLNKCWVGNMYAVRLVTFRLLPYSRHHIGWICIFEMQIEAYNDTVILSHIRAKRKSIKSPLINTICTESNINNMCRHKKEGLFWNKPSWDLCLLLSLNWGSSSVTPAFPTTMYIFCGLPCFLYRQFRIISNPTCLSVVCGWKPQYAKRTHPSPSWPIDSNSGLFMLWNGRANHCTTAPPLILTDLTYFRERGLSADKLVKVTFFFYCNIC